MFFSNTLQIHLEDVLGDTAGDALGRTTANAPLQEIPLGTDVLNITLLPLELLQPHDLVVQRNYFIFLLLFVW
jgi:hypothetical protein